jgi:hypothetical protein
MKKDPTTQTEFLDAAMKVLDEKPSFLFWTNLAQSFEKQTRDAARCELSRRRKSDSS